MSHNVLCALTLFSANQHKHALLLPEDFPNSEVESKWLQWPKATLPYLQSAWSSAKHCPGLQLLCRYWQGLHLLLGHQEQGSKPCDFGEKEGKPLHFEKKCKEEEGVPAKEAKPFTCETK